MNEFQVSGRTYRAGKLSAMRQFHVIRRLAPVIAGMADAITGAESVQGAIAGIKENPISVLQPIVKAIGQMSDEDCEYVLMTCLSACHMQQPGGGWAPVAAGGNVMFADLELSDLMTITGKVLEANLSSFFAALPAASSEQRPQ